MKEMLSRITPLSVILIASFIVILIPFQIIGYGFLPPDDAGRHAAKVVSGKDWGQILVLRPEITMDSHPGWHAILGAVRRVTGWDAHSLVLFSVICLFILFAAAPIFFVRYPESWLASLIILAMAAPGFIWRLVLGRPYIFTMAITVILCLWWQTSRRRGGLNLPYDGKAFIAGCAAVILLIAASTYIHCSWYLFCLPFAALLLAREWRASAAFGICAGLGVIIGASLTGQPLIFLKQMLTHLFLAFGKNEAEYMLVSEFRPGFGDTNIAIFIALALVWCALRGKWRKALVDNPVFILAVLGFIASLFTRRAWLDWGFPAVAAWTAWVFDDFFASRLDPYSPRRLLLVTTVGLALFMSITADINSRWTSCKPVDYISADDPRQAELLPEPGGIIYSSDMGVFYQIFFRNPRADWRYILGFEPTLMPKEDLEIFRDIQRNPWTLKPLYGWIKKMRPQDRLILRGSPANPPRIPDLEWNYAALNTWIGRLPKK
jgi:hypothetical protein